jgi:calcineurin-like phosphoesterase family protein
VIWFTADHHFGHENIIRFCTRPFVSAREMDEAMIARWNEVVQADDVVWHLGDFVYRGGRERARSIFERLAGTKHLVVGNHDRKSLDLAWASKQQIADVTIDKQCVIMCHYAMRVWPGRRWGAIHLFAHSHGKLPATSSSLDVGVDCWDFAPVDLARIRKRLASAPAIDPLVVRGNDSDPHCRDR